MTLSQGDRPAASPDDLIAWFRARPGESHELRALATRFRIAPELLRDRLRRLVEAGVLAQSAPITGFADSNPTYQLVDEQPG